MSKPLSIAQHPLLVPHDPGYLPIPFQYHPEGMTRDVSVGYAEASSLSRNSPIIQFTRGSLKTIRFDARLFAPNSLVPLEPWLVLLERSIDSDPALGRPPIWAFVWGVGIIAPSVVIRSIGNIRYNQMRRNGTLLDVTLSIELAHYEPFSLGQTDPDARDHDTFYYHVKDGDLWETIAATHYGKALLGDLLRRANPTRYQPVTGEVVKLFDPDKVMGLTVMPASAQLQRNAAVNALRSATFTARGAGKQSTVVRR